MGGRDEIREGLDNNRIAFLNAELKFGFTFIEKARAQAGSNNERGRLRALRMAKESLETTRKVCGMVRDIRTRQEIEHRAAELEKLIRASR